LHRYTEADAATAAALCDPTDGAQLARCLEKERERRLAAESKAFSLVLSFSRAARDRERMTERLEEERTRVGGCTS
jgi:hypothetical protein